MKIVRGEARKYGKTILERDDGIGKLSYVCWYAQWNIITLDGDFTTEELRAIITFIEEHNDGANGQRSDT